jgi:uncharacterized protein
MKFQNKNKISVCLIISIVIIFAGCNFGQSALVDSSYVASHYAKYEYQIPMRDGKKLFTAVYVPRDTLTEYPFLIVRTPYSVGPYGKDSYPSMLGPSTLFTMEGYIFVYQDVRGAFMSEGDYVNARPQIADKKNNTDVDESSDAYDTIDWLIKNIRHNNGKAGLYGISYPGFYAALGLIDAHPALKVSSPQAPVTDWFLGDDFHHNGALFLPHAFNFLSVFGKPRKGLTTKWQSGFTYPTQDGYSFHLQTGSLKNLTEKYLQSSVPFWNEIMAHGTYDDYWKAKNPLPYFKNIAPAVMVVGGLFDAEDLYGALNTYKTIKKQSPSTYDILVLGPWSHGAWSRTEGDKLGDINFQQNTGEFFRSKIEFPFYNYCLKDKAKPDLPGAYVFESGSNVWRKYDQWPPANLKEGQLFFYSKGKLRFDNSQLNNSDSFDEYASDPNKPVPFSKDIRNSMHREYMVDDQRFASERPDVLVYETEEIEKDITLMGPIEVNLYVATTGTDADFIVKLIDVFPDSAKEEASNNKVTKMGGYQMMVRGDVMRGKFRNSFEKPEPFEPNKITKVAFTLQDINHAFRKGHRIMVQVQSSWFPLVDRNPQKFEDIYNANPEDFQKATQRIYHSAEYPSYLKVGMQE